MAADTQKWMERCPDCPPGDEPDGAGMWFDANDCLVVCETCGGSGMIEHDHQPDDEDE